ncbi:MAG TPA: hypothetical protein VGI27_05095 [Solirubrobacteraceae bacterium]
MNPPRPTVNVDALGALLDRALGHPFARVLEDVAPKSIAQVRAARANLPETLGRLQARAASAVGTEIDAALAELLAPLLGGKKR